MKIKLCFKLIPLVLLFITFCNGQDASMDTLTIHYHRYDNKYKNWALWTWLDEYKKEIISTSKDKYGLIFKINIDDYPLKGNINFVPKFKDWQKKDAPDRYWVRTTPTEIWLLQGIESIFYDKPDTQPFIRKAFLDDKNEITVITTKSIKKTEVKKLNPKIILTNQNTQKIKSVKLEDVAGDSSYILKIRTEYPIDINELPGILQLKGFKDGNIHIRGILDGEEFISNEPLGVFLNDSSATFSVYAPGASGVTLNLYKFAEGGSAEKINLEKSGSGTWKAQIDRDASGMYYTYSVFGNDETYDSKIEVIDPYARCVTKYDGRGIIFNDNNPIHDSPQFEFEDAVIYEMHVRDFSIAPNSGIKNKGKFLGFTESGSKLRGTNLPTGIDHLVELGINTIQLMPIQDFEHNESEYFWGYMPVNFNSPAGWFATNSMDASKVSEFKKLVDALHKKGIKVVMDVVYNHTAEGSPGIKYNFNGLAPNFYYRQHIDGSYWNGSGCGNEVRSEHPMVRRFILESLKYWVEEFKIDGFRFDLMGLHDMVTMKEIVRTLKDINPDIFIYGEPWTAGATPITPTIKGTQRGKGFAVFNDNFRDAMKGPWYNTDPGFLQKGINTDNIKKGIIGSITDFADSPQEVINYVVCHDGRTLWDHLKATVKFEKNVSINQLKKMDKLAAVLIFTSQGVPFIHGGQEFLRNKFGSHNSYNQPDSINMVRWELKQKNYDIFEYYKGLIELRKNHPVFKMTDAKEIKKNLEFIEKVPDNCIAYIIKKGISGDSWSEVLVLINPNKTVFEFQIPKNKWNVVVNDNSAGINILDTVESDKIIVNPISAIAMYR